MKRILLASAAVVSVWTGVVWQHPTRWLDDLNVGQVMLIEPAEAALQSQIVGASPTLSCSDLAGGCSGTVGAVGAWDTLVTSGSVVVPAWVTASTVGRAVCAGGGGGGGGNNSSTTASGFSGAGAGVGTLVAVGLFTAGATITPTIGQGGTAGASSGGNGGAGGNTVLILNSTTYTAPGGSGGTGNGSSAGGLTASSAISGWTDNQPGGNGFVAGGQQVGGASAWSPSNIQNQATAQPGVAPATGAIGVGGTGGRSNGSSAAEAGGAGANGACRFTANGQ
jgi:hypothetical protein